MDAEDQIVHLPMLVEKPDPPRVRGDCLEGGVNEARPCPWVGCFYNVVEAVPGKPTCVLDVADEGGTTLEEVGDLMGVTRERIRQIEARALRKLKIRDNQAFQNMLRRFMEE